MNGPNEVEHMEVDIGFMPKMELNAPNPSSQVTIYSESGDVLYEPSNQQDTSSGTIVWDEEISMEDALRLLEMEMYPFKKVRTCYSETRSTNNLSMKGTFLLHNEICTLVTCT